MRQLTKTKWFGPTQATRLGIRPVSWQGISVCLLFILLVIGDIILFNNGAGDLWGGLILAGLFVFIVYVSGGSPNNNSFN
jgi:hypothetical protein